MIAEQNSDRERTDQPRQHCRYRILRRCVALDLASDQMADHLGIRLAFELPALGNQFVPQRLEVLDDAVVDQRDRPDDVRVRVADGRRSMCGPTRMRDPGRATEWMLGELVSQIVELALRAPPLKFAVVDRADAG